MDEVTAAALVCAGLLSVLIFPAVATLLGVDDAVERAPATEVH